MQRHDHHVIFDEISYDRQSLITWYREHQHLRRDFGLFQNQLRASAPQSQSNSTVPFTLKLFDTIDTWNTMGRHIVSFEPVRRATSQFKWPTPIKDHHVDILIYRPGWQFHPHTDHSMNCGIMFPILPSEGAAPIDFYQLPPGQQWGRARDFSRSVQWDRDWLYSYHYSLEHPSMFNGRTIHGVRNGDQERVFLRIKLVNETFESVIKLAEQGQLFGPR
jgi:hypothetical protein